MTQLGTMNSALAATAGVIGAATAIAFEGDGTSRRIEVDTATFEDVMTALQLRAQGFEPRTHAFRPYGVKASLLVQRIDRLWSNVDAMARDNPRLVATVEELREMAELSENVTWSRA